METSHSAPHGVYNGAAGSQTRQRPYVLLLLEVGSRRQPLPTRVAEVSGQAERHRRGRPGGWTGSHRRRGLPVGIAPSPLAGSHPSTQLVDLIDRHCPKRRQGLTTGQYLAIAAISPHSKRSMWVWFSQTVLQRHMPSASEAALASQRFWDHMDSVTPEAAAVMWKDLLKGVIDREQIDLSSIGYDGTNFYTFLDTFNTRCNLAARGKNKQERDNLRQVSYALFCTTDGQLPLFYDVYQGNRNDARQFSLVLERFHQFFRELAGGATVVPETTLIFDKGNNSADNFRLLDSLKLKFVGSVKQNEHPELAQVPHSDRRFVVCASPGLKGAKAFRVTKTVAGSERVLVVTYNPNLAKTQWMTLQNDVAKASKRLSELQGRLAGRAAGLIKGGKRPTLASVEQKCRSILRRQHLKDAIQVTIEGDPKERDGNNFPISRWLGNSAIVPFGKNFVKDDLHALLESRSILPAGFVYLVEEADFHLQSGGRFGLGHVVLDGLQRVEDHSSTRPGQMREQAVLNRIVLRTVRRVMGHADLDAQPVRQFLEVLLE